MFNTGIESVFFDMDGVIIDSEPLWTRAEKKVLETVGINLTTEMSHLTKELNTRDTVNYWHNRKPWQKKSTKQVEQEIMDEIKRLINEEGSLMPGLTGALKLFSDHKMKMAVASGSPNDIIQFVLKKFDLNDFFVSYRSCDDEEYAKPHPAVYLSLAEELRVKPENCIVFEDTFFGLLAAKSARMRTVALLQKEFYDQSRYDFSDLKIRSFSEFTEKTFTLLSSETY